MTQIQPALERVDLHLNSTLAKKLVGICTEFLTWVEHTRLDRTVDGKVPRATPGRIAEAAKYAKKTFAPAVEKLVAEELKLRLKVIICPDVVFDCMMMSLFKITDLDKLTHGQDLYSGTDAYDAKRFDPTVFATMGTRLDLTTSQFTKLSQDYVVGLFIFAVTYLGDEVFGHSSPWTASEHAAVILHELGHGLSIFEHMTDVYHRADLAGNSIRYLNEQADDKTVLQTAETLRTDISHYPDPAWAKQFEEILDELDKYNKAVSRLHPLVAGLALIYLATMFLMMLERLFDAGSYGALNDTAHKTSDTTITQSNSGYNERIADEFVSRHGLGAALGSALQKLHGTVDDSYVRSPVADAIHNLVVIKTVIGVFNTVLGVFGMLLYADDGTYDPPWLRFEHILRNNMVIFKDPALSPELRDHFIQETTELMAMIAQYNANKRVKLHNLFWGTLLRITSRGSLLDGFSTAGLSADYDILQQLTNGLIKNKLYYYAARLKSL